MSLDPSHNPSQEPTDQGFLALSRRRLLQAGSVFGLLYAAGCASQGNSENAALPKPQWPEEVKLPSNAPSTAVIPQRQTQPLPPVTPAPPVTPVKPTQTVAMNVIPRTRWTTAGVRRPGNVLPLNGVSRITVHHDAQVMNGDSEGESMSRLASIQNAHMRRTSKRGEYWADIGYHYIIDRAGRVWEGRPIAYQGAHVEDHNEHNIGVMCMGNFMQQAPTKAQTDALDRFVAQLMHQYRVPLRSVYTHQELDSTLCPGTNLQRYMQQTRARGGPMALAIAQTDPGLIA